MAARPSTSKARLFLFSNFFSFPLCPRLLFCSFSRFFFSSIYLDGIKFFDLFEGPRGRRRKKTKVIQINSRRLRRVATTTKERDCLILLFTKKEKGKKEEKMMRAAMKRFSFKSFARLIRRPQYFHSLVRLFGAKQMRQIPFFSFSFFG